MPQIRRHALELLTADPIGDAQGWRRLACLEDQNFRPSGRADFMEFRIQDSSRSPLVHGRRASWCIAGLKHHVDIGNRQRAPAFELRELRVGIGWTHSIPNRIRVKNPAFNSPVDAGTAGEDEGAQSCDDTEEPGACH